MEFLDKLGIEAVDLNFQKSDLNKEEAQLYIELVEAGINTGLEVENNYVLPSQEGKRPVVFKKVWLTEFDFNIDAENLESTDVMIKLGKSVDCKTYFVVIDVYQDDNQTRSFHHVGTGNSLQSVLDMIALYKNNFCPRPTLKQVLDYHIGELPRFRPRNVKGQIIHDSDLQTNKWTMYGFNHGSESGNGVHVVVDKNILFNIEPVGPIYVGACEQVEVNCLISYPLSSDKSRANSCSKLVTIDNNIDMVVNLIRETMATVAEIPKTS